MPRPTQRDQPTGVVLAAAIQATGTEITAATTVPRMTMPMVRPIEVDQVPGRREADRVHLLEHPRGVRDARRDGAPAEVELGQRPRTEGDHGQHDDARDDPLDRDRSTRRAASTSPAPVTRGASRAVIGPPSTRAASSRPTSASSVSMTRDLGGGGAHAAVDLHHLGLADAGGRQVQDDLAVPEPDDAVTPAERDVDLVQAADDREPVVGGDLPDELASPARSTRGRATRRARRRAGPPGPA